MLDERQTDPTVLRRRLRSELRRLREEAGLSQREVAALMDWSLSKLLRIETGAVRINTNELRVLLSHYQVTDAAQVTSLVELARSSREQSWWAKYKDLISPEYGSYLGFESSARIIRSFNPLLVPGLIQTEEYAREVINVVESRNLSLAKIEQLIELRMERQDRILRQASASMHFILDEAVLHRAVSNVGVMQRQLHRLMDLLDHPRVTIRVIPFRAGIYPTLRSPYFLLEFADSAYEDVLFIETTRGDLVIRESAAEEEQDGTAVTYLEIFWQLEQLAPKEDASRLIERAMTALSRDEPGAP